MILAIDTATRNVSLALRDDHAIIAEATWRTTANHTTELAPAVDAMLRRAGITPADLAGIGVALGPGSFTGLRIGMSFAKGLVLASGGKTALVGVPTLDIIAAGQPPAEGLDRLCAVVEAGRGRVSAGLYERQSGVWEPAEPPFIAAWDDLAARLDRPTLIAGDVDPAGREKLAALGSRAVIADPAFALRRAGFLAEITHRRLAEGRADNPASLAPNYLH